MARRSSDREERETSITGKDGTLSKTLYVKTYGCQMNVYDSVRMADVLAPLGYRPVDSAEGADMVILNTCHIREHASDKVYSALGRLRLLKEAKAAEGKRMTIAVAGCVAQAEGSEILRRQPAVDIVVGPQSYHRLPELVARASRASGSVLDTDFPADSKFDRLPDASAAQGPVAFLTIQEGCDKFCSFCVVPYTRGAEASRPVEAVLAEARRMVAQGAREIVLLGQNVNAYRGEGPDGQAWSLARLLGRIADIDGLERLRYTTSHPRDMSDDLIGAHGDIAKLMPYLHLPLQSGSDAMLEAMNRRHRAEDYLRIVERLRRARPDIALTSDFIVGHPGESDADFEATMALVERVGFAQAYSFKYSARPGTPAAGLPGQVPLEVMDERLARLQALILDQAKAFNLATVGREIDVLFERDGHKPGQRLGKSPYLQSVHVTDDAVSLGDIRSVRIVGASAVSLEGRVGDGARGARAA